MGKAIEGAAMLGAAVGMGALAFFNPALVASPIFDKIWASLIIGGISMEAGAIAGALTQNRGQNITTRQPASFRQIVYGTQRVGGVIVYASTTGSHKDQYNRIIVLAGHEIDSIEALYLDGRKVYFDASSAGSSTRNGVTFGGAADGGTYSGPNGQQYNFGGLVYCEAYYGDQTSAPNTTAGGGFSTGLNANDPTWAVTSSGTPYLAGCAYVYLKIEDDANMFPSQPEIRFTLKGKNNIFDPRTATTGYSENWALIVADVLTDAQFGLGLDYATWINNAQLIAAANVCDEQVALAGGGTESRYKCHFHYDTSLDPGSVLETMMPGAAGRLSFIGGQYYIWPAYWQGPSFDFGESNVTTDTLTWNPYRPFRDRFNRVNGTYIAPNYPYNIAGNYYDSNGFYDGTREDTFPFAFQPTNYPQYAEDVLHGYTADAYLAQDNGIFLPKELGQQTVLSIAQAQRVAKIALERNRQQGSGTWGMGLECFGMQEMDVMRFTFGAMGWSAKQLECQGVQLSIGGGDGEAPSIRLGYTFAETASSVYEWAASEELSVYDVPAIPPGQSYTPAPPTSMTLTSGAVTAVQTADGVVHPRIEVQWVAPLDTLTKQIRVRYALTATPTAWIDNGTVDAANTVAFIPGVVAGAQYNVAIRGERANGGASAWVEIDAYSVVITLSVVGSTAIAQSALLGVASTDGSAGIIVSPFTSVVGNVSVSCLAGGEFDISGLAQQQLYEIYYVDPAFAGGAITPIATQNTADYLNRPGYFLIGSIVTPYAATGAGGGAITRYAPSMYADGGNITTSAAASAYDGNLSTCAVVNARFTHLAGDDPDSSSGDCTWGGFPAVTTTAAKTLYVVAGLSSVGTGTGPQANLVANIGASNITLASLTGVSGTTTYTASVPLGTVLSNVSVEATATADSTSSGTGSTSHFASLRIYEIYIQ